VNALRSIELCPCSGGIAEGFRRAGHVFDLAFDYDADACDSYEQNLGHRPIRMDVRDLLRLVQMGWRPLEQLDLLVADPPCTPWSAAGKGLGMADERDLMVVTVELIRLLRPRAYLIANVPGLQHETNEDALEGTIGQLCHEGYCTADFVVLDAADFGVPQHRVRPFWYGHLGGACITWPSPTHGAPTRQTQIFGTELAAWVTCRQALCDLPVSEIGHVRELRPPKRHADGSSHRWSEMDEPGLTICSREKGGPGGGNVLRMMDDGFPPSHIDEPARTVTTRSSGGGNRMLVEPITANAKHPPNQLDAPSQTQGAKERGNGASILAWPWDRPATTVCAENWIPQPGHTNTSMDKYKGKPYQGWHAIVLSERARARLQGFPDGWVFAGKTKRSRSAQIGMAMPPRLAEHVARAVLEQIGATPR
jgi:site-specific DNA-cytosine methylase